MKTADLFKQYLEHLFAGKRGEARQLMLAAQDRGVAACKLLQGVIWPAMEQVEKLYREHHISGIVEHMATRINRMIADQLQGLLPHQPRNGRRIIVTCGDGEGEELGAQIVSDLFEAAGWSVWFLGAGVPDDELVHFMGTIRPDVLCIHGAKPSAVPGIRKLIERARNIGACQDTQIMVCGGVFKRADGLADEVKADLYAGCVSEALQTVEEHPVRIAKPDMPEPGRRRKRKALSQHNSMRRKAQVA